MKKYKEIAQRILDEGTWQTNRTGVRTKMIHGVYFEHDMSTGFPLLTTKQVNYKSAFAETLGFIKGFDSAKQFRELGSKVWDANANETESWLKSPHRKGTDDLGNIYGVQARSWPSYVEPNWWVDLPSDRYFYQNTVHDQLKYCVDKLNERDDNRRLIVNHWNVDDVFQNKISLPPCHINYMFGLDDNKLNMMVQFRSWDFFLGAPFNLAGYGLLLELISKITNLTAGKLIITGFNVHLYETHMDQIELQLTRKPFAVLPSLQLSPKIDSLEYITNHATLDDIEVIGYMAHKPISAKMLA